MDGEERTPLVAAVLTPRLSWLLAALCIIDLFGVFPVVALPRPIINCGWIGLPVALLVFSLQIYTASMLGKCWLMALKVDPEIVDKSRYPYAAIAELCFGTSVRRLVTVLLDATIFGGGIPNLLVASQLLQLVCLKEDGLNISFCYWMLILGVALCPIMWLGSPKDMKWVAVTSCGLVVAVAVITWSIILMDTREFVEPPEPGFSWEAIAVAYGVLAFQFDIHPLLLTLQVDMDDQKKLNRAIVGGFTVSGGLFLLTSLIAYHKYGSAVMHNLLSGLPEGGLLYLDIVLVTMQICLSMVVGGTALFQDIEDRLDISREFNWRRCVVRSVVVLASVLIAETVPRFDLVMGLLGGALTGPLMFIFPPLFYIKLQAMQARELPEKHRLRVLLPEEDSKFNLDEPIVKPVLEVASSTPSEVRLEDYSRSLGSMWIRRARVDVVVSVVIVLAGVLATLAASYFSMRGALESARITPACFPP